MAGPLSNARRDTGDVNLTGGANTSVLREFSADAQQVRRSVHMDRPVRTGKFAVKTGGLTAGSSNMNDHKASNLREKGNFKAKRKRK